MFEGGSFIDDGHCQQYAAGGKVGKFLLPMALEEP
jgi:hypothetical protein